jgi:TolB-like protein
MDPLSDPLARLTAALGRRYAVERELGRGGMGTVYLALDRKHGRRVAIKVLPPDLASALGPERFLREIRIAAQLSHPHILPLHDSGEAAGVLYYVMPHVDGESLRDRLTREKQLPVAEAVEIARQIAGALSYAHGAGVIHRDIKPENILLAGGHALLADFGVAKALADGNGGARGPASELRTDSGLPLGTVAYASPEQAAGSRELDGRTDIYSLGCVLYEMLVGESTGGGPTASQILEKRFTEPLPAIRSLRAEVPEWVERALTRALARNPTDRYPTAAQFREALTASVATAKSPSAVPPARASRRHQLLWMTAGAATLAIVAAAVAFLPRRTPSLDPKRVVVAGFENRTGDPALDPVGDIATDYIARGLASTRLMHDVYDARVEARAGGAKARPSPGAGRELARRVGAGTVIWGSYYREGDSLHFEAQLIDAPTGRLLLSMEPAVGVAGQKTEVVERLRQRVMGGFAVVFGSSFEPWESKALPPTYEAYQELLAASDAGWQYDWDRAIRHYRRAIALDSAYTGAKTGLLMVLSEGGRCGEVDSLVRLLEPDRARLSQVDRGALDYATATCRGDLEGALQASRTVTEAKPRSVGFSILASIMALEVSRPREALRNLERLDPARIVFVGEQRTMYWDFLGWTYHQLRDYRRELEVARKGMRADPGSDRRRLEEAIALAALGRITDVERRVDKWLESHDPSRYEIPGEHALCVALELRAHGQPEAAQVMLGRIVTWYRGRPADDATSGFGLPCLWHMFSAAYYAGQGDAARAGYERLAAADTANVSARAALGLLAVRRGDRGEVSGLDQWLAGHHATYNRVRLAALLGDRERAVTLLREVLDHGFKGRMFIHIDPDLDSLRGYPPYEELMRVDG